jgi:SAM-dependent methyltransferase
METISRTPAEREFLEEINRDLPQGVDWKAGAVSYLGKVCAEQEQNVNYHYIKPFSGGPDHTEFFHEMYRFLNSIQELNLPMRGWVLDVGCGPGWTSHYLAKLGYKVLGIDISQEMVDVSGRRRDADPFQTYPGIPLDAEFMRHDIEAGPLPERPPFEAAIFESTVHHFFDPVSALKNVARSLGEDGVIVILEGAAPPKGSDYHKFLQDIMAKYHTLERPYSRAQMERLLDLAGFPHRVFYAPINGLFEQDEAASCGKFAEMFRQAAAGYNIVIASRKATLYEKIKPRFAVAPALGGPFGPVQRLKRLLLGK